VPSSLFSTLCLPSQINSMVSNKHFTGRTHPIYATWLQQ
jgi:hypothetical protein